MREPTLEHMQSLGAPEWFCRKHFPAEFRGDRIPPTRLREDRQVESGGIATMKLKRRKPQPKARRKRRVQVERYRPSPMDFAAHVKSEAQFASDAHRAAKLAGMNSLKCLEEMKKGAK